MRLIFLAASLLSISGCASWTAYVNRDASENEVQLHRGNQGLTDRKGPHQFSVVAFTANRRAMAVSTNTVKHPDLVMFCAEPPPDAASSILAADSGNLGLTGADTAETKIAISSTYAQAARSIAARSPLVEIYRTYVYSVCQMYANGALSEQQVYTLLADATKNVVDKMDGTIKPVDVGVVGTTDLPPCATATEGAVCKKEKANAPAETGTKKPGESGGAASASTVPSSSSTVTATATATATTPVPTEKPAPAQPTKPATPPASPPPAKKPTK